ncbi:hypothetical protein GUJ93_ZPchr0006g45928 [Zizania palustris]|uniref:Uncharacterized protein n=1 Tax=Zizania palustris TaxID=103762 RepID=A0A8J5SP56_ZIZPA|nr:hypothetical protein GUJ93_ZPchr0006g45928 [Zizania palustris]
MRWGQGGGVNASAERRREKKRRGMQDHLAQKISRLLQPNEIKPTCHFPQTIGPFVNSRSRLSVHFGASNVLPAYVSCHPTPPFKRHPFQSHGHSCKQSSLIVSSPSALLPADEKAQATTRCRRGGGGGGVGMGFRTSSRLAALVVVAVVFLLLCASAVTVVDCSRPLHGHGSGGGGFSARRMPAFC